MRQVKAVNTFLMLLMLINGTEEQPYGARPFFNHGAYILTRSPHIFRVDPDFGGLPVIVIPS